MQSKTTVRSAAHPLVRLRLKTENSKCWWGCGAARATVFQVRTQDAVSMLETRMAWPCKVKYTFTIQTSNATRSRGDLPKRHENRGPHKVTYTHVYNSIICNSQKNLETTQMCINSWLDKPVVIHHTLEYYPTIQKNKVRIHIRTAESQKQYAKWMQMSLYSLIAFLWSSSVKAKLGPLGSGKRVGGGEGEEGSFLFFKEGPFLGREL